MTVATLREQEAVVKQLPSKTWTGPAVPQPHHILVALRRSVAQRRDAFGPIVGIDRRGTA